MMRNFHFLFLNLLFFTNAYISLGITKNYSKADDSLYVDVYPKGNKLELGELCFFDEYQNQVSLVVGKNIIPKQKIIHDYHGDRFVIYPIPNEIKKINFIKNEGYWYINTGNIGINAFVNFEVYHRKQISPINEKNPLSYFYFFTDIKDKGNYKLRVPRIVNYYNKKRLFLEKYSKKYRLTQIQVNQWQEIINYQELDSKLNINFRKCDNNFLKDLIQLKEKYNRPDLLPYDFYRTGLQKLSILLDAYKNSRENNISTQFQSIIQNFQYIQRDYLLTSLLIQYKNNYTDFNFSNSEFALLKQKYFKICQNSNYKLYVKKITELDDIPLQSNEILNIQKQAIPFSKINNNQITYIDFWASWCGPCIDEIPLSKKLKLEYLKRGINFVYISFDSDTFLWEKAIIKYKLEDCNNYLLPKGGNSKLAQKYKINSIPHYMIVDKNGKVINADAPRPSDPKIKIIFNDLLKMNTSQKMPYQELR